MGETVEERAGQAFGAEHLGPFVERQIGGDQGGTAFIALAEHFEQQFGAGLGQRHEVKFVDDQKLVGGELSLEPQQLLVIAGLDEFVDQRGGGDEADRETLLAGRQAQVDLAQFRVAFDDEPGVVRIVWLFTMVLGNSRWLRGLLLFPGISQWKQGLLYRTIPVTDFSGQGLIRYGPVGFFSKQTVSKPAASVEACSV